MENLLQKWLKENKYDLEDFNGQCLNLVQRATDWLSQKEISHDILMIKSMDTYLSVVANYPPNIKYYWRYHFVIISNDVIHDAWLNDPLPKNQYFELVFPNQELQVDSCLEEDEKYIQYQIHKHIEGINTKTPEPL